MRQSTECHELEERLNHLEDNRSEMPGEMDGTAQLFLNV
jgi:hypothetical protein